MKKTQLDITQNEPRTGIQKRSFLIIVAFSFFYLNCSYAQSTFSIKIYSGYSFHQPAEMALNMDYHQYKISNVSFSSRSLQFPLYYGIEVGGITVDEKLPIHFSLEFIHDKTYVRKNRPVNIEESTNPDFYPGNSYHFARLLDNFSMSHGFNFILLNLSYPIFTKSIMHRNFLIYIGLGAGVMLPHVESEHDDQKQEKYELHGPAGKINILGEYSLFQKWFLIVGIKYTIAWIENAAIVGGDLSMRIHSWHLVAGIGYRISI